MPLALDVFVNVNTSSADRHVNVTVDHARTEKKRKNEGTRKIRLGINADLTLDDCSPGHCTRGDDSWESLALFPLEIS